MPTDPTIALLRELDSVLRAKVTLQRALYMRTDRGVSEDQFLLSQLNRRAAEIGFQIAAAELGH